MELNPFEIKAEISRILNVLDGVKNFEDYEAHYRILDSQDDKTIISKLLFREINNKNSDLIRFLLVRYCPKQQLTEKLWEIIKNNLSSNQAKIFALDLLRDIDSQWTYEECEKYLDSDVLVEEDTQKIINKAIINPEVQIDFLDFLSSLPTSDKIVLLNSLAKDYSNDELANMLIPVFLSNPDSEEGKVALDILGNSKSQLAYHALISSGIDSSAVKKNISILKMAGIREDNTIDYYKSLLKDSKPYKFCITYPDGQGNQAVIFSRINKSNKIQFVAVVIDDYKGIRDCFGFNEISEFECNAIIERFYQGQRAITLTAGQLKAILKQFEKLNLKTMSYEYICWKSLLADIEPEDIDLNYKTIKISNKEFEYILKSDFTDYWFLDEHYSDEFEEFIKLANNTETKNFDKIIEENTDKIFYDSERDIWTKRILNVAILKNISGDEKSAKILYSLYYDKAHVKELFKNIIRKSLYEYYYKQKNEDRIKTIENMWVK